MATHCSPRVLEIDGVRIAIELVTLRGDAGTPDTTATFALNLVLDRSYRMVCRRDVTRDFAANLTEGDASLARLYELSFGWEHEVRRDEYDEAKRARRPRDRAVRGSHWSGPRDAPRYHVRLEGDWDAFQRAAAEIARDARAVDAVHTESYERWDDAARPRVTLRFEIAPPDLARFLRVGMAWESAVHR